MPYAPAQALRPPTSKAHTMTTEPKSFAEMSGLEQLQVGFQGGGPRRGIGATLGFTAVSVEEGKVVFGGTPTEDVYNPIGTVHGGIIRWACPL